MRLVHPADASIILPEATSSRFIVSQAKDVLRIDAHVGAVAAALCNSQ